MATTIDPAGSPIYALIFDLDGTCFDTEALTIKCFQMAAEKFNSILDEDLLLSLIGHPAAECIRMLDPYVGGRALAESILQFVNARCLEEIQESGIAPKKGLEELLDFAANHKMPCAIASSSDVNWVRLVLGKFQSRFEAIVTVEDIVNPKPAPDSFLEAASRLGVIPGECLALEDSPAGLEAATSAGMRSILIPDLVQLSPATKKLAWRELTSLSEVAAVLRDLNSAAGV